MSAQAGTPAPRLVGVRARRSSALLVATRRSSPAGQPILRLIPCGTRQVRKAKVNPKKVGQAWESVLAQTVSAAHPICMLLPFLARARTLPSLFAASLQQHHHQQLAVEQHQQLFATPPTAAQATRMSATATVVRAHGCCGIVRVRVPWQAQLHQQAHTQPHTSKNFTVRTPLPASRSKPAPQPASHLPERMPVLRGVLW